MNMKYCFSCFVFVLFLTALHSVCLAAPVSDADLARLIEASGLKRQTAELPAMIKMSIEPLKSMDFPITTMEYREIEKIIDKTVSSTELCENIVKNLKVELSEAELKELFQWYDSEIGRKITAEETKNSTTEAMKEIIGNQSRYLADEKRVALVRKIEEITQTTEKGMRLQNDSSLGVFVMVSFAASPFEEPDTSDYASFLSSREYEIRSRFETMNTALLCGTLRDVTLGDLEKYASFYEKASTRKFTEITAEAMLDYLKKSFEKMKVEARVTFRSMNSE